MNLSNAPERMSLAEEVFRGLRSAILRGRLKPGQRLIEEMTAAEYKTSRTPVREAFFRLEQEGLIDRRPRGGFTVGRIDAGEIDEIMDLRGLLEAHAAALAARRADPEVITRLTDLLDQYQAAVDREDVDRMIELNTMFHDALYRASGSPRLLAVIAEMRDHFYRLRQEILVMDGLPEQSHQDHLDMLAAIKAGDIDRAEKLVREHINRARLALRRQLVVREGD